MSQTVEYTDDELTPSALDTAYTSGVLTLERVRQAILSVDNDGYEGIPWSRGMRWIVKNQACFLHLLRRSNTNVADFFRDNFLGDDNRSGYTYQVLSCDGLIRSLLPWRRQVFVRDMLVFGFSVSDYWLKPALKAGVSRKTIGEIIIEKLLCEAVDLSSSTTDFTVYEFLMNGSGRVERYGDSRPRFTDSLTYWSALSDEQFWQAMNICARKVPSVFFGGPDYNTRLSLVDRLRARLSDEQVNELLITAAANLPNWYGTTSSGLLNLSDETLLTHMRRIGSDSPELVIRLVLRLDSAADGLTVLNEFYHALSVKVSAERLVQAYKSVAGLLIGSTDDVLVPIIRQRLENAIRNHGWIIGYVEEGTIRSGKRQGRTQLQVTYNGQIYIENWRDAIQQQSRYTIQRGDFVACDPAARWYVRRLTPKVTSLVFEPILMTPRR